ncbi:MAG: hypothetical protein PVH99_11995 [Desulfobacteraceae bacterium]|jgi:hypothetical protein
MKREDSPEEITITGYVTPTEWDWNDDVSAVSVETHDDMYAVQPNSLGEELFSELDSEVEVTGFLEKDRDGARRITVTSYEVLTEAGDREEDNYGDDENGQEFGSEQGESPM